jgi:hypothetical protein
MNSVKSIALINSRGSVTKHATPAASEGIFDARGIVPPAIPRIFFLSPQLFTLNFFQVVTLA